MNPLKLLFGGGLNAITGLVTAIFGNKAAREANQHSRDMAGLEQFAAEFRDLTMRTWWDSLIDGINRLPRPTIVFLVIAYFILSFANPILFQQINIALDSVPERMWWVLGAILSFYFVAREFKHSRDKKMAMTRGEFNEQMRRFRELEEMKPKLDDDDYRDEMADDTKPLSLPAIQEWNRRQKLKSG